VSKRITKQFSQSKERIYIGPGKSNSQRNSFLEVIIGISRTIEALIKGVFYSKSFSGNKLWHYKGVDFFGLLHI